MKKQAVQNERDRINCTRRTSCDDLLTNCGVSNKDLLKAEIYSRQVRQFCVCLFDVINNQIFYLFKLNKLDKLSLK